LDRNENKHKLRIRIFTSPLNRSENKNEEAV
jgi:hypothetical protein